MPETPFTRADKIVERIVADLGEGAVPMHLRGVWTGFIAAEFWEAQQNPSASVGRGTSQE